MRREVLFTVRVEQWFVTLGFVACLALVATSARAQQAERARIDPAAQTLLARVAAHYHSLNAYGDGAVFTATLKSRNQKVVQSFKIPFQFVRPNRFAVDCGTLGLASDGKTLKVVNFLKQYTYETSIARKLTTSTRPEDVNNDDINPFLDGYRMSLLRGDDANEKNVNMLLGQTGAQAVGLLMTLLVEENAAEKIEESSDLLLVERGPGTAQTLRLGFRSRWEARLVIGPDDLLIRRITLIPKDVREEITLEWESGPIATDQDEVLKALSKQAESFRERSKDFGRITPMGNPFFGDMTLAPVPPPTVTIFDRLRSLISKLRAVL